MKINNVDISTWSARQSTVQFGQTAYGQLGYWNQSAAIPKIIPSTVGFKSLTVTLIVKGANRQAIQKNVSDIVAACRGQAVLQLDGFTHWFTGYLTSAGNEEMSKQHWHRLTLQFSGYERGQTIFASGAASIPISNPGNLLSPAWLTITPTSNIASLTVSGINYDPYTMAAKQVTIPNVVSGRVITLNGINGSIAQAGAPKEVDMWHLPAVLPGDTTIQFSSSRLNVQVQVIPIYA